MSFNYTFADRQQPPSQVYNAPSYNAFNSPFNNNGMPPSMSSFNPKNKPIPPKAPLPPLQTATPVANAQPKAQGASTSNPAKMGIILGAVLVSVVILGIAGFAGISGANNSNAPKRTGGTSPQDLQIENEDIIRTGEQFIGLAFFTEMDAEATAAFENAQARWSSIVGATLADWPTFSFNTGTNICGSGETTIEPITFDFLLILAGITPIDGPFGILGQAGPCRTSRLNGKVIPTVGRMEFDSADIDLMKRDGTLVSVILHEMGHVLGIGTLWGSNGLIQNEVASANINQQPIFTGAEGTRRFDLANDGKVNDGFTNVPVENGFTNGRNNGAGQGSLNGHWDQDGTPGELMVFQISSGAVPPLSAITVGALQDAGYKVDFGKADSFSTSKARIEQAALRGAGAVVYDLSNDIAVYDTLEMDSDN